MVDEGMRVGGNKSNIFYNYDKFNILFDSIMINIKIIKHLNKYKYIYILNFPCILFFIRYKLN